jgi:hypothetical protein
MKDSTGKYAQTVSQEDQEIKNMKVSLKMWQISWSALIWIELEL